jgi:flagellar hook protein FlgE
MMRALFAAIGGLRNHITYMDVVGNNIANVNTAGFKASRVTFQDMLSQTLAGASAPSTNRGGTNPTQVGLGMTLAGIDVAHTQGALQATGKPTDFAIQGAGFFIVRDGSRSFYARDGAFDVSVAGELVNPTNGYKVQGWNANAVTGVVDTSQPVGAVAIPFGQSIPAQETTALTVNGNIDSRVPIASTVTTTVEVYDSLGLAHPVTLTLTKSAANTWAVTGTSTSTDVSTVAIAPAAITFSATGTLTAPAPPAPLVVTTTFNAGVQQNSPVTTNIDFTAVTQFAGESVLSTTFNNGFAAGSLVSFSVGPGGDVTGIFSNGTNRTIAQIALAIFTNPGGLQKAGANLYESSANSGVPRIGTPGTAGRGTLGSGVLEGSNTDLAREFTNVVIAQRGFQASSRIISTSDQMLQDLVSLTR